MPIPLTQSVPYYTNINPELLSRVPLHARRVLEVGCGAGRFAQAFLARNPAAHYVGVELLAAAAQQAAMVLRDVITGDIEQAPILAELDRVRAGELFDTLIFGDVLEHLRDPWHVLAELRARTAVGGICVACIPNVAHWSVLQQQLKGRWDYADAGLLDRTHLRFFTMQTAVEMFRQAGWTVLDASPRIFNPQETAQAVKVFESLAPALGVAPEKLRSDLSAFQWVIRAMNGPAKSTLNMAALGLKKVAGVTEARVDHPLSALHSIASVRASWGAGGVSLPQTAEVGVLVLHRQFMNAPVFNSHVATMISRGWVIVSDMDDDPRQWPEFVNNQFFAYRSVHAVTVSTEPLADLIRQWNPNVQVFPNSIFELPPAPESTPKQGDKLRVFFGALNRLKDWQELMAVLISSAQHLAGQVEFVVVHDQDFFDALPTSLGKEFHPTLTHDRYMSVLATCDVALLPLADTPFNRLKSDLKFIECCAAGEKVQAIRGELLAFLEKNAVRHQGRGDFRIVIREMVLGVRLQQQHEGSFEGRGGHNSIRGD